MGKWSRRKARRSILTELPGAHSTLPPPPRLGVVPILMKLQNNNNHNKFKKVTGILNDANLVLH